MSAWTYVHGMLEVDTFAQTSAEAIFKVQTVIDHLPQITGSEGPARFTVVPRLGHNTSSNCDELEHRSNLGVRHGFREYCSFEAQTRVLLMLCGELRDRYFEQTLRETTKCLARLSTRADVLNCLVRVSSYEKEYIFNDPQWMIEAPSSEWTSGLVNWKAVPTSDW